jgi:DNA-binding transcriptional MerR regulator
MAKKYKIGKISQLLGIPVQTLHYYEQCGFVTPIKDRTTNYRYFDTWDVNFLLDGKYLRALQYSNSEIGEMLTHDSVDEIQLKYEKQKNKLIDLIYHYQNVLDTINEEQKKLADFRVHLGVLTQAKSLQVHFSAYRINHEFQASACETDFPCISEWIEHMPFITATFKIPVESIMRSDPEKLIYWWGFSVETKKAKNLDIPIQNTEYIPSQNCLYTVFKAYGRNTFTQSLYEQVLEPCWNAGYEISGDLIGRLVIRSHENGQLTRYFELWIPV